MDRTRNWVALSLVICSSLNGAGCDSPTKPSPSTGMQTPVPTPAPTRPPANLVPIGIGDVVRFQFTLPDSTCVSSGGRCRSYLVTAPSAGTLEAVLTPESGDARLMASAEMYIVPGADFWDVGPGPQSSCVIPSPPAGSTRYDCSWGP